MFLFFPTCYILHLFVCEVNDVLLSAGVYLQRSHRVRNLHHQHRPLVHADAALYCRMTRSYTLSINTCSYGLCPPEYDGWWGL